MYPPWLILLDLKRKKHKLLRSTLYRHVTFPLSPPRSPFSLYYHRLKYTLFPSGRKSEFYTPNAQHLKTELRVDFSGARNPEMIVSELSPVSFYV